MPTVEQLLLQQNEQLNGLNGLLDRELHLISTRDPEQLLKVVEEKSQLLGKIQATDMDIETALAARKPSAFTPEEQSLVDKAQHTLETCKHCTAINEKAVEQGLLKLGHLRQLITDMRVRESMTYDKSGQTKGGTLGKGISA